MTRTRRVALALGVVAACALVGTVALSKPRPVAAPGPEGDALAREVEAAVDKAAWERTRAVRFTFAGRTEHLWDRDRALDRLRWGDTEVLLDLTRVDGRVTVDGAEVTGRRKQGIIEDAFGRWINDTFWLNPLVKLQDEGVTRAATVADGAPALLVTYTSGGLTPGDAYLWLLGPDRRPVAWRMWVKVIPIGGVRASWEGWQRLATGAWVATEHRIGPITLRLTGVEGAATLTELTGGEDVFGALTP